MVKTLNLVLIGDTRSGKTSFVNTISQNPDWGKVGQDDGESTTIDVKVCSTNIADEVSLNIFDTPGMNDSRLRLSNRQIKERIEMSLLSSLSSQVDAFIITESLQADSIGIRRNATNLVSTFGPDALKSSLVLLTKQCYNNSRSRTCQKICSEINCSFFFWKNNHRIEDEDDELWVNLSDDQLTSQIQGLLAAINELPKFSMTRLEHLKNEIVQKATKLREEEPLQYESVGIEIDVPYLESKTVAVVKQRPVIKERRRGGVAGMLGDKKSEIQYENYPEEQIVYEEKTRKEARQELFALPKKPLEHYIEIVKKEAVEEFKTSLTKPKPPRAFK